MSILTPAQAAQQSNRTDDGRYTTKTTGEAEITLTSADTEMVEIIDGPDEEQPKNRVFELSREEFAATESKIANINARAAKRGFTGNITITGTEREVTEMVGGFNRTFTVIDTTISGDPARYEGWEFLAAVDTMDTSDGTTEHVLRCAPGVESEALDRSGLRPHHCGHCNVVRPNRVRTFLLRNTETGEHLQVGTTCLKDHLGWNTSPVFIDTEEVAQQVKDGLKYRRAIPDYSVDTVIAVAYAEVEANGYRRDGVSRDAVQNFLSGNSPAARDKRRELEPYAEQANKAAPKIISELVEGLDHSSYGQNLKTLLRAGTVQPKHMGILVSAIAAHRRMSAKAKAEADKPVVPPSEWAGEVGEKITVNGTVEKVMEFENTYGYRTSYTTMVIVRDGSTVAKMFTAAKWADDVEEGQQIQLSGTVKEHSLYGETKQTVLKRPQRG